MAAEDQIGLIGFDRQIIGIQNVTVSERERLSTIVAAISLRRPVEAPRRILAGLRRRAREIEIAIGRDRRIVHPPRDVDGIRQALRTGPAPSCAHDTQETTRVLARFAGADGKLLQDLERFRASRPRYRRLGVPYHRGYMLYGPPGTGKTSLVSALAANSVC
jgi:hypothetical protein